MGVGGGEWEVQIRKEGGNPTKNSKTNKRGGLLFGTGEYPKITINQLEH